MITFPRTSPDWPCQNLPLVTQNPWGSGNTQSPHCSPDERDPVPVWQLPRLPFTAISSMKLDSGCCSAPWDFELGATHEETLDTAAFDQVFSRSSNLDRWEKRNEGWSTRRMLKQKHQEGETVGMCRKMHLFKVLHTDMLQWEIFLGHSPVFSPELRIQLICCVFLLWNKYRLRIQIKWLFLNHTTTY